MVASRGTARRCAACAKDVHDLTELAPGAVAASVLFRRETSICARLRPAAIGAMSALAISCSAPRDATAPAPDERVEQVDARAEVATDAGGAVADAGTDSDIDGIPDAVDACPSVPGKANADAAKNGCPEVTVVVTMGIVIVPQFLFARGKSDIPSASQGMIDNVIDILKSRPEIKRVQIEGHASTDEARPLALSEARARTVQRRLLDAGIDPSRVDVKGYGTTMPADANATNEGRAHNRRVTFKVEETADGACPFPGTGGDGGAGGT
jgi:OOP family OmpA-OmpF porin